MEGKTVWVSTKEEASSLDADLKNGWVLDPVLMPTGRPNIVEGLGAIYHLAKFADSAERETYIHRFDAPPAPLQQPVEEEVILGSVSVENTEEAQAPWRQKGYFILHKDHIGQRATVMSLLGPRPKPAPPQEAIPQAGEAEG